RKSLREVDAAVHLIEPRHLANDRLGELRGLFRTGEFGHVNRLWLPVLNRRDHRVRRGIRQRARGAQVGISTYAAARWCCGFSTAYRRRHCAAPDARAAAVWPSAGPPAARARRTRERPAFYPGRRLRRRSDRKCGGSLPPSPESFSRTPASPDTEYRR